MPEKRVKVSFSNKSSNLKWLPFLFSNSGCIFGEVLSQMSMTPDDMKAIASSMVAQWISLIRQNPLWASPTTDPSPNANALSNNEFLRDLKGHAQSALRYEENLLLEKALDCIPLQRFYEEQEKEDDIIRFMLHWFKNEFFTWVDQPPCHQCGCKTRSVGRARPNPDDLAYGARVIELYECLTCRSFTRFPRYNDPGKLLETRRGRCGEWANCFTLCCRAVALEARIVYDKTDHLWTEIYSETQQRWIHCDPCEDAFDRPLMYSMGWNKKLTYCIAFSADEVVDVTRRYTRNWPEVLSRRNLVSETGLAHFIHGICQERQLALPDSRKECLTRRRVQENEELLKLSTRVLVKDEELFGRQSGSLAWRTARGECKVITTPMKKYQQGIECKLEPKCFNLCGTARHLDSQTLRLTQAKESQCGATHYMDPLYLATLRAVQVEFGLRITGGDDGPAWNGADGMAFVIQSTSARVLGEGGCDLGYGGLQNSLAIEFDTYQSSDRCADPSQNHISVHGRLPPYPNSAHHEHSLGHTSMIPAMNSGQWIYVQVRLFIEDNAVEVALKERIEDSYANVLKVNVSLLDYLGHQKLAWIGMTASTGGISQNQDVRWLRIVQWNKENQ